MEHELSTMLNFRSDCYRNNVFLDIYATQLLQYSEEDLLTLTSLLPSKNDNPVFYHGR